MKNKSDFKIIRAEWETGETQWQQTHFRRNSSIRSSEIQMRASSSLARNSINNGGRGTGRTFLFFGL